MRKSREKTWEKRSLVRTLKEPWSGNGNRFGGFKEGPGAEQRANEGERERRGGRVFGSRRSTQCLAVLSAAGLREVSNKASNVIGFGHYKGH